MARLNGEPKYPLYRDGKGLKKSVENLLKDPVLICPMAEALTNFDSFRSTFRITKLFCFMASTPIGLCLVEIPFRLRNFIYYMIGTFGHYTVIANI